MVSGGLNSHFGDLMERLEGRMSRHAPPCDVPPQDDVHWMKLALAQAKLAAAEGEVPVGAVVVRNGQWLASGRNAPIAMHDPTAHAEVVALRAAAQALGNYRLEDCTLYVTLEPCAMCSGAMLHARLARVVFGAADAKTGAAGSVLNLFSDFGLNHHTAVQGGVQAHDCAQVLKAFFAPRRINAQPLRQDALRTPEHRFGPWPDVPWVSRHVADLNALAGLRMHYLDECNQPDSPHALTLLCLHDIHGWCVDYRHAVPHWLACGARVVAPDLIGFGQSDKPKKEAWHQVDWHAQVLHELVSRLELTHVVVLAPAHGAVADVAVHLIQQGPSQFKGLLQWTAAPATPRHAQQAAMQDAPFPDKGFRAAQRAWLKWADKQPEQPALDGICRAAMANIDLTSPVTAQTFAQWVLNELIECGVNERCQPETGLSHD
jgi:tRNA(adenine34) deaminase